MTGRSIEAIVVDTNVFGAVLGTDPHGLTEKYENHLLGKRLVISFQTVAELRYGALKTGWATKRTLRMEERFRDAAVIPPHDRLASEWAALRHACRLVGHGLHEKSHFGDLWIAATARLADLPLVTHDSVFDDAPGLEVIRER